ncbi:AraC family transcriptional regulator [Pendulispora albinea]|uniref:Helix-turn-helix transcriptional regulator n=1 Tax=Pendulispora albinea TaxID=2741071 RepID=A0ABZ2LV98_9BACT
MDDDPRKLSMAAREDSSGPLVLTRAGTGVFHGHTRHRHARGQLIAVARGVLAVETEAGAWVVPARHAVWLPPHHVHSGRTHGPVTGWSLYVAKPACAGLRAQPCTLAITPLLWEAAIRSAEWGVEPLDEFQARLALVIVDEIRRLEVQPLGLPLPQDARLQRIARALLRDPADRRNVEEWAAWAGLSTRTLTRRFVLETSLTFTEWVQRARLMRALEMLAGGAAVTTVAIDAGYRSVSAFIALFKRNFGVTPSTYFERRVLSDPARDG